MDAEDSSEKPYLSLLQLQLARFELADRAVLHADHLGELLLRPLAAFAKFLDPVHVAGLAHSRHGVFAAYGKFRLTAFVPIWNIAFHEDCPLPEAPGTDRLGRCR